jgi:hypothetical protein
VPAAADTLTIDRASIRSKKARMIAMTAKATMVAIKVRDIAAVTVQAPKFTRVLNRGRRGFFIEEIDLIVQLFGVDHIRREKAADSIGLAFALEASYLPPLMAFDEGMICKEGYFLSVSVEAYQMALSLEVDSLAMTRPRTLVSVKPE